ncbi:MAG: hypothetical protein WCC86_04395 [Methanoregula sp.]|uniref:hypothetical protein n=1 Tax=Methanoregula sp. TaxID=2052170 RepID=UPI003BAFF0C7
MKKIMISQVRCGAANPYALLASRTGKKISRNLTPGQIRQKFEDEFNLPYEHLFDPVHGSPLFACNEQATSASSINNIETGETASRGVAAPVGWAPFKGSFLPASPPYINDVNQGCSINCWFIAALASVAWIWPDFIRNFYPSTNANTYLKFYKAYPAGSPPYMPTGGLWTYTPTASYYKSSYSLPYGAAGVGNYLYASPNPASATTSLWASLMEKTYAEFFQLSGSGSDEPNISTFSTGNPLNSLIHLTGKRYYCLADVQNAAAANSPVQLTETAYYMTEFNSANSVFNTIYNQCYVPTAGANPAIIATPMVAWTYLTAPTGVTYSNETIVANHCYSILGVHNISGTNYIVLRNPWGMSLIGGYGQDPDITDGTVISSYSGTSAANATWTVSLPPIGSNNNSTQGTATSLTVNLAAQDGIFAITPAAFLENFAGFGWAY